MVTALFTDLGRTAGFMKPNSKACLHIRQTQLEISQHQKEKKLLLAPHKMPKGTGRKLSITSELWERWAQLPSLRGLGKYLAIIRAGRPLQSSALPPWGQNLIILLEVQTPSSSSLCSFFFVWARSFEVVEVPCASWYLCLQQHWRRLQEEFKVELSLGDTGHLWQPPTHKCDMTQSQHNPACAAWPGTKCRAEKGSHVLAAPLGSASTWLPLIGNDILAWTTGSVHHTLADIPVGLETGCFPEAGVCRRPFSTYSSMSGYHEVPSHGTPLFLVVIPTVIQFACKAARHSPPKLLGNKYPNSKALPGASLLGNWPHYWG